MYVCSSKYYTGFLNGVELSINTSLNIINYKNNVYLKTSLHSISAVEFSFLYTNNFTQTLDLAKLPYV